METFVERFPHLVLFVFGGLLLALAPILFWCLLKRTGALDRLSAATHWLSTRPRLEQMFILFLLWNVIVFGSTKPNGWNRVNDLRSLMSAPRLTLGEPVGDVILPADILRGYRVAGTGEDRPVEMPAGAVTNDLLRRRGGHDWAFRVEPDNWRSSWKGGFLTGVTVFARGEVRPDVGTLYFPVPLTNGVSLLPEARWGMLSHAEARRRGDVEGNVEEGSVFSHAVTTNGSLLLDWRNAAVGRDANSPTNLQMEIFSDGSFVWRTDGGSTSYLPVLPFDWDGDGLENSVDPEPLAPSPVDAHGTSAEWCRIVCSNVFTTADNSNIPTFSDSNIPQFSDSNISFRPEVNANAYYFVDVVAEEGPAPVWFNADRDSRLGSPVVVALAGETNRVPLLIGVEYSVTSTVPFSVFTPTDAFAVATSNNECSVTVKWPLEFTFVEDEDTPGAYTVEVVPYDPGVAFTWNSPAPGGGASRRMAAPLSASSCACWGGSGPSVVFDCSDHCDCGGGCRAEGTGCLEEAEFAVTGGVCRCSSPDEPHEDTPPLPDPLVGGLSVSFSKGAVIFEDAYRNTEDGPQVPWQSTTTRLTVSASGGPFGGSFTLTTRNLEKLIVANGPGPVALTPGMTLGPYETYSATFECAGVAASGSENDVEVEGTFTEAVTGWTESPRDAVTVVRVELEAVNTAPANPCRNRHVFGVYEEVSCMNYPNMEKIRWKLNGGALIFSEEGSIYSFGGMWHLQCPLYCNGATLEVMVGNASYCPNVLFVEPEALSGSNARAANLYTTGSSGAGMHVDVHVFPRTVSFANVAIKEIPVTGPPIATGWYTNEPLETLTHTIAIGAGHWCNVDTNNFVACDNIQSGTIIDPGPGTLYMFVPVGWHHQKTESDDVQEFRRLRESYDAYEEIYEYTDAVLVRKFGHECLRYPWGPVLVDGLVVEE